MDWFINLNVIMQAFLAATFTFLITSLGSAIVFCFKKVNKNLSDILLGVSAGIMLAASYFSLLAPAIDQAINMAFLPYIIVPVGFLCGGLLLFLTDKIFSKLMAKQKKNETAKRIFLLVSSITIHNIPEGMAVGVLVAGAISDGMAIAPAAAMATAIGIAVQNVPEGAIISMPMRAAGNSRWRSFLIGGLSGIVEPVGALLVILLASLMTPILPYFLAFAAGAMIYVVVEELIPEASEGQHSNIGTVGFAVGFVLMMVLDVVLG